jgi:hypothetical protein
VTASRERSYAGRMFLAALLLAIQQPLASPPRRPDLSHGFVTERLGFELELPGGRRWALVGEYDEDLSTESKGLVLSCGPGEAVQCEMRRHTIEGRPELHFGAVAEVPAGCGLRIDARMVPYEGEHESGAWVRAWAMGDPATTGGQSEPGRRTIEAVDGHLRVLAIDPYLQLRLVVSNATKTRTSVKILSVCCAGFDRSEVPSRAWGPMPGGCGLSVQDWYERERRFRERSRQPHPLEFCGAPDSGVAGVEASSSAACLAMLLPRTQEEKPVQRLLPRIETAQGFVEPGGWLPIAHEAGTRGTLECFSIWPDVEMVLGGAGPFAIRVRGADGEFAWVVLSSFDEQRNALVYDPRSKEPQPLRWSREELEKRWFGTGGLAFACRR